MVVAVSDKATGMLCIYTRTLQQFLPTANITIYPLVSKQWITKKNIETRGNVSDTTIKEEGDR